MSTAAQTPTAAASSTITSTLATVQGFSDVHGLSHNRRSRLRADMAARAVQYHSTAVSVSVPAATARYSHCCVCRMMGTSTIAGSVTAIDSADSATTT